MPNSTTTYWDINGTSLNQFCWNIVSLGGDRLSTPPLRGTNVSSAIRPGTYFRPKIADERKVSLAMWVQGTPQSDTGNGTPSSNPVQELMTNVRALQKLFYNPRQELILTRRWTDNSGTYTAQAKVSLMGQMAVSMTGPARATLVVDLAMANPFYYASTVVGSAISAGGSQTFTNVGDDATTYGLSIDFVGPLTNPVLTNSTTTPSIVLSVAGTIASGHTLTADVWTPRAAMDGVIRNDLIKSSGSQWWLELMPGANTLAVTGTGAGSVVVSYKPAYV